MKATAMQRVEHFLVDSPDPAARARSTSPLNLPLVFQRSCGGEEAAAAMRPVSHAMSGLSRSTRLPLPPVPFCVPNRSNRPDAK